MNCSHASSPSCSNASNATNGTGAGPPSSDPTDPIAVTSRVRLCGGFQFLTTGVGAFDLTVGYGVVPSAPWFRDALQAAVENATGRADVVANITKIEETCTETGVT